MSTEENKALIRRYIEAINSNDSDDWSVLDDFIAEDVVVHNPMLPGAQWNAPGRVRTIDRTGIRYDGVPIDGEPSCIIRIHHEAIEPAARDDQPTGP